MMDPEKLQDQEFEGIIYDPNDQSAAVMVDAIPGSPRITAAGIVPKRWTAAAVSLLVPLLAIGGNAAFLVVKLLA